MNLVMLLPTSIGSLKCCDSHLSKVVPVAVLCPLVWAGSTGPSPAELDEHVVPRCEDDAGTWFIPSVLCWPMSCRLADSSACCVSSRIERFAISA